MVAEMRLFYWKNMAQPVAGYSWNRVTGVGTTIVFARDGVLRDIIFPGTFVGSVEFYDSATIAGTAAANNIFNVALPLLNQWKTIPINAQVKKGLVFAATGTPTITFTYE